MARGSASKSHHTVSPLLSSHDITRLLLHPVSQCISDEYPWVSNDEALIDKHFKGVCAQVMRLTNTQSRIESNGIITVLVMPLLSTLGFIRTRRILTSNVRFAVVKNTPG